MPQKIRTSCKINIVFVLYGMMGPYSTKNRLHFQEKETNFGKKMHIWYVYSIIEEELQKVLNKKIWNYRGGHK